MFKHSLEGGNKKTSGSSNACVLIQFKCEK